MPIHAGDPVMWMMLTRRKEYEESNGTFRPGVYPEDYWAPRNLPLIGKYNDHGGIEDVEEGVFMDMMLDMLRIDMVEREPTDRMEAPSIKSPVKANLNFENVQQWLHEGVLLVDSNAIDRLDSQKYVDVMQQTKKILDKYETKKEKASRKSKSRKNKNTEDNEDKFLASRIKRTQLPISPVPVVKILILKEVWDHLYDIPASKDRFGDFARLPKFKKKLSKFVKALQESAKMWKDSPENFRRIIELDPILYGPSADEKSDPGLKQIKDALYWLGHDCGPYTMSIGRQANMVYERVLDGTIDVDTTIKILTRALEFAVIRFHVHDLRITWEPTTGSGSQMSALDTHMRFAKFCAEYAYLKERGMAVESLKDEREWLAKAKEKDKKHYLEDIESAKSHIRSLDRSYRAPIRRKFSTK